MFVQVIEGRVADAEALARQMERWTAELRPGATGFLGSTGGVTDDGRGIVLARFESPEAARANSDRPEQGKWWSETEKAFDGAARFTESTDVDTLLSVGSDDAGFVQVMLASGADRELLRELDERFEDVAPEVRPDLIGSYRAWTGPDSYVQVAYFTNEADARTGEAREIPAELAEQMDQFQSAMGDVEYLDLRSPLLTS